MSAYLLGADPTENEARHAILTDELGRRGLVHCEFTGTWEGQREKAVAVKDIAPEVLEEIGRRYGQEAVVYVAPGTRKLIRLRA